MSVAIDAGRRQGSGASRVGWPVVWVLDRLLAGYQRLISPLLGPACRFHPSCSHYARQALAEHTLGRATLLTLWRLLRCQPLCPGGHDPVPPGRFSPPAVPPTPSAVASDDKDR